MILTNSRETGFSRTLKMFLSPVRSVTKCFSPSLQLVVVFCGQGRLEQCKQYPRSLRETKWTMDISAHWALDSLVSAIFNDSGFHIWTPQQQRLCCWVYFDTSSVGTAATFVHKTQLTLDSNNSV